MSGIAENILPTPINAGFVMDGYWVWGGSPIEDEEGMYQLYASRWTKDCPFFTGYLAHSEVVRASADSPTGPFKFEEVVFAARGKEFWDGLMTHNPTVYKYKDEYLLFYIGSTYEGGKPSAEDLEEGNYECTFRKTFKSFCIGMARAKSAKGPWVRSDKPVLSPREGKWDCTLVTNPAPCILEDGTIYLYYRSCTPDGLRIGLASAPDADSEFVRVCDEPVLNFPNGGFVEDPYVWRQEGNFRMLAKDMTGSITGEKHAGVELISNDGIEWKKHENGKGYSRNILWDNGNVTTQGCLERPQLLFKNGKPACLYAATGDGPGGFRNASKTWNVAIPLKYETR